MVALHVDSAEINTLFRLVRSEPVLKRFA